MSEFVSPAQGGNNKPAAGKSTSSITPSQPGKGWSILSQLAELVLRKTESITMSQSVSE